LFDDDIDDDKISIKEEDDINLVKAVKGEIEINNELEEDFK